MATTDFAILADVKTWLAGSSGMTSADDAMLGRLITDVSGAMSAYLSRSFILPLTRTERYDGNGKTRLYLRNYPVTSIGALSIGTAVIPAVPVSGAESACQAGYLLELWDGLPPGRQQALDLFGYIYRPFRQNVVVTYAAGYQESAEAAMVPASSPYEINVQAPSGPWASDCGVTYADGSPLQSVSGSPSQGQYVAPTTTPGQYTFSAADAAAAVLISYGFIPAAINNACIEWVAERYRYRTRIGQSAQTVQGQMTSSYSLKDMPDFVRLSLDPYRNVVPL